MNEHPAAIVIDRVSKTFRVPHERRDSLKQSVLNIYKSKKYTENNVLQDISLQIKPGEFFGIVGKNGSGKSTLLKIIAGIYQTSAGEVSLNGSLSPFIELGVGFNPELSGRDNVFLNGALLGLSRRQIERKYDDIVEFSELRPFMDQKLKNYSSGMQVRLAFSVAIQAEADILLIDEVLAVGDIDFQRKCFDVFMSYKNNPSKTVVFITHDMSAAEKFCDRVAVIDEGKLVHCGGTAKAVELYYHINAISEEKRLTGKVAPQDEGGFIGGVRCMDPKTRKNRYLFEKGSDLSLQISLKESRKPVGGIGVALFKEDGSYCFGTNTYLDKVELKPGSKQAVYQLSDLQLLPGKYYVNIGVFGRNDMDVLQMIEKAAEFRVEGSDSYHGVVELKHNWSGK